MILQLQLRVRLLVSNVCRRKGIIFHASVLGFITSHSEDIKSTSVEMDLFYSFLHSEVTMKLLALLGLLLLLATASVSTEDVSLGLGNGRTIGETITVDGRKLVRFLGIPYAQPPIGSLRFRRPVPPSNWTLYEAKSWPNVCIQHQNSPIAPGAEKFFKSSNISEDCLYLNVWSPDVVSAEEEKQKEPRPVLVFIHGGGLIIGSSSFDLYDGEMLAAKADAVVVTFNYRVSTLGFLYSDDHPDVKGNQGFWDQTFALKWIQANIKHFGGDPTQVTIMGESAGGWSTSAHILSPASRGLFKRAIVQSGALVSYKMILDPAEYQRRYITGIRKAGCASPSDSKITKKVVECLQKLPAEKIDDFYYQTEKDPFDPVIPLPVIDGEFIPEKPEKMLASKNYKTDINLLVSTVEDEGSFVLAIYASTEPGLKARDPAPISLNKTIAFLPDLLSKHIYLNITPPEELFSRFYFSGLNGHIATEDDTWRKRAGIAFGDLILGCPTLNFAKQIFKNSPGTAKVYQFYYKFKMGNDKFICPRWGGACHCNDLFSTFGMPFRYPEQYLNREREVASEVINFIASFIRTGTPGPQQPEWYPYFYANDGTDLIAPYYEINNDYKKPENFKFNLKQLECSTIWGRYYN